MQTRKRKLQKFSAEFVVSVLCVIGRLGLSFKPTKKAIYKSFRRLTHSNNDDDFKDDLFKNEMRKTLAQTLLINMQKTVNINKKIPDLKLYLLSQTRMEASVTSLHTIHRPGRPLVVNFGSCT